MEQGMEYIWRVYQEGSFSKAAEKLFMTQPALSIAVRRVERNAYAVFPGLFAYGAQRVVACVYAFAALVFVCVKPFLP